LEYKPENGFPAPLGVSKKSGGFNFALFSEHATDVWLSLFAPNEQHPFVTIQLDPYRNKTTFGMSLLKIFPHKSNTATGSMGRMNQKKVIITILLN
jgi:pullulanase/glycogen debranching enzyme